MSKFFKIVCIATALLGIWPFKFKDGPKLLKMLYLVYSIGARSYFLMFTGTQIFQLYYILESDFQELLDNMGVSLLYLVVIVKIYVCTRPQAIRLIDHIEATEKKILSGKDEKIKEIYKENIKHNYITNIVCISVGWVTIILFFVFPIIQLYVIDPEAYKPNNFTEYPAKPLPFSSWFPFNKYQYYKTSYALHIFSGLYGCFYTVCTDILFYSFIIYGIGQMKILQYMLKNFRDIAKKSLSSNHERNLESAIHEVLKMCAKEHQIAIRYVKILY